MPALARRFSQRQDRTNRDNLGGESAIAFKTELDWMAVAAAEKHVLGVVFGYPTQRRAKAALWRTMNLSKRRFTIFVESDLDKQVGLLPELFDRLRRYATGEPVDFADVPIDQSHLTPFGKRIVAACRRIGWGRVRSYGELAAECGSAGAARAVGQVMAKNRYPLVVPCHRVLGAGGSLGGFSAPEGLRMKRRLLELERRSYS